jgi:hypothetical protein
MGEEVRRNFSPLRGERGSQRGVALVLTLIMLAIITVVTVIFLATARRHRQASVVQREVTQAEFAADAAYQRASSDFLTNILSRLWWTNEPRGWTTFPEPNLLAFDFLVSAPLGYDVYATNNNFRAGTTNTRPYLEDSIPIVANHFTNIDVYLDLNRNREFDDPRDPVNAPYGDPIWIGILDKPWLPHGNNNRFVARIAYVVLPVGKSFDVNTIHNGASPNRGEKYLRNQGYGPWELNLGAFLAELTPSVWWNDGNVQYDYSPFPKPVSSGAAFVDALAFCDYRRKWTLPLPSLTAMYPFSIAPPGFPPVSIDAYSDGRNGGEVFGQDPFLPGDDTTKKGTVPWAGSEVPKHFFHIQEFFEVENPNATPPQFRDNLTNAIGQDPHAYYRMIAQLGTDPGTDFEDRIHLNYVDHHATFTNLSVTNFVSWDATPELAVAFFTNVAERIFLAQSNDFNAQGTNTLPIRSINEIPIYPTNLYSTAIHRILQQAANIFDATHTNIYPSVFRPLFGTGVMAGVNYVVGYTLDNNVSTLQTWLDANTNGIPLVVGAKKGFPNFNEFSMRADITVERKLQVVRNTPPAPGRFPLGTNQMYVLGISNYFGAEAWNSYFSRYTNLATISVSNFSTFWLSNDFGYQTNATLTSASVTNVGGPVLWQGTGRPENIDPRSFKLILNTNQLFLSNAVYRFNNPSNLFVNISTNNYETDYAFPLPYWIFTISNRFTYLMEEKGRIVDFVVLNQTRTIDLVKELADGARTEFNGDIANYNVGDVWLTNRTITGAPSRGIQTQLGISLGTPAVSQNVWSEFQLSPVSDKTVAIQKFQEYCGLTSGTNFAGATNVPPPMETPFNPAAKISSVFTWQANDPLVHYHSQDLTLGPAVTNYYLKPKLAGQMVYPASLTNLNYSYSPWGGRPTSSAADQKPDQFDYSVKDAGVYTSDYWNFPTNKLANVGLLGRIHRGTPWQTVSWKSRTDLSDADALKVWENLSADVAVNAGGTFSRTYPTNDWRLADMFTTAIDERTSRGLMSINQTNLESWSALLSGVVVLSNSLDVLLLYEPHQYDPFLIEPWARRAPAESQFYQIWTNIYQFQLLNGWIPGLRTNTVPWPMERVGDLLQIPQLTVHSPFVNTNDDGGISQRNLGLDDFAYEQIPQQILSLLRVGQPRFVIYAYGQTLKPVDIDPSTGIVRNYQVTAEYATRTVVRIEGDPRHRVRTVVESFNVLPPD